MVTTGRGAYRRKDGIAVIPLALLGPCAALASEGMPKTLRMLVGDKSEIKLI